VRDALRYLLEISGSEKERKILLERVLPLSYTREKDFLNSERWNESSREALVSDDWYLPRPWNPFSPGKPALYAKDSVKDMFEDVQEKPRKKMRFLRRLRKSWFD